MKRLYCFLFVGVVLVGVPLLGYTQNLDALGKNQGIKVSGGISANQIFYGSQGLEGRLRQPYNYFLNGNLNLDLFGLMNAPISFSFSNQNAAFMQPFNQFVFRPTYKGLTLHLGTSALNFNPYTLAGHRFNGLGLEYRGTAFPLRLSLMYGTLRNAVEYDALDNNPYNLPSYRRRGMGLMVGTTLWKTDLEASFLKATDDETSIAPIPQQIGSNAIYNQILPEDNLTWSLSGKRTLLGNLAVHATYAASILTNDVRAAELDESERTFGNSFGGLFRPRTTTNRYEAYKMGLQYSGGRINLGFDFEHIDPRYRTLGGYYFNNDFENYTANLTTQLWQNKVSVSASGGLQKDNLDNAKTQSQRRLVGSASVAYVPTPKVNFNLTYSNYSSFTNVRSYFDRINQVTTYNSLDTLNYRQISQNFGATLLYMLSATPEKSQAITTSLLYQASNDRQGDVNANQSDFYNMSLMYSHGLPTRGLTLSGSFFVNGNSFAEVMSWTYGPVLGITKKIGKSFTSQGSVIYNYTQSGSQFFANTQVLTIRGGASYQIKEQHRFNLDLILLNRKSNRSYSEQTVTLGYQFNFKPITLLGKK